MFRRKPSHPSPIRQSQHQGCRGRGTGLLGHSWQTAFVLDDFNLKICPKNVPSKEGKPYLMHRYRLLSPLSGVGRRGGHIPSLLFIELCSVEGSTKDATTVSLCHLAGIHQQWPAFRRLCFCDRDEYLRIPLTCHIMLYSM